MADFASSLKGMTKLLGGAKGELQSIESILEKIDTVGSKALGRFKGIASSFGQLQLGRGKSLGLGTDGANIPDASAETINRLRNSLSTSAAQQTTARMPVMPTMTRAQAQGTMGIGIGQAILAPFAGMYAAAPNLGDVASRAAGYYGASITNGMNRTTLEKQSLGALNGSFGRGVSGIGEDAAAAAMLTQGYNYSAGSNAYLQTMKEVGGAARYLNMGNATAAQALGGFQTGSMGANLYQYGIAQFDQKGNARSQGAIATDIYKYFFGNQKLTADQVSQNLQYGTAGASLQNMGFSQDQQQILSQQFKMIANGQNPDLATQAGANNPLAPGQQMTSSQTQLMQRAEQPMLDGFKKAADIVTNLNKKMEGLPDAFFELKGILQGISGSNIGQGFAALGAALMAAVSTILLATTQLKLLAGLRALGATGSAVDTGIMAAGRSALATGFSYAAGATLAAAPAVAVGYGVAKARDAIGNAAGVHGSAKHWAGFGAALAGGAIAGGTAGAVSGGGIFDWLTIPVGATIGTIGAGISYAANGGFSGNGGGSTGFGASFGAHGGGTSSGSVSALPTSPVPGVAPSYGYGAKSNDGTWTNSSSNSHKGLDYPVPAGTDVVAVRPGIVIDEGLGKDYGIYVQIQQEDGYQSIYAHLSSKSVHTGDSVAAGQSIGKSGATGNVTGPHLHYEVRRGKNNPVDPKTYLGSNNSLSVVSGKTSVTPGTILGTGSQQDWAKSFLQKLGKPVTTANVQAMTTWMAYEGGQWHNSAHYNPLNTTQPAAGASNMNSVGVKSYKSWDQGFQATVDTINNGRYGNILSALSKGDSTGAVLNAINKSPWGTHIPNAGGGSTGYGSGIAPSSGSSTINHITIPVTIQNASDEEAIRLANKVQDIIEKKSAIHSGGNN